MSGGPAPLALVYRGKASVPGCPESAAALLRDGGWGFDVRFVGERERLRLDRGALAGAALYVQPGGGSLRPAWRRMRRHADAIRGFVDGGGRYLGLCLGGYLAGRTPGFGLLPGDAERHIRAPQARVRDARPHLVGVDWQGHPCRMYFQDGPVFTLDAPGAGPPAGNAARAESAGTRVLARYRDGSAAALVAGFGRGRVAVCGPHPEATPDWFADDGLPQPGPTAHAAGLALVDALMTPAPATAAATAPAPAPPTRTPR